MPDVTLMDVERLAGETTRCRQTRRCGHTRRCLLLLAPSLSDALTMCRHTHYLTHSQDIGTCTHYVSAHVGTRTVLQMLLSLHTSCCLDMRHKVDMRLKVHTRHMLLSRHSTHVVETTRHETHLLVSPHSLETRTCEHTQGSLSSHVRKEQMTQKRDEIQSSVISNEKGTDVYVIFLSSLCHIRKRQVYFIRLASHKAIALYVRKGQISLLRKTQISISSLFNRALISERDSALFHHSCIALSYQISISSVSFFCFACHLLYIITYIYDMEHLFHSCIALSYQISISSVSVIFLYICT